MEGGKKVARIEIGTDHNRYLFTIPNLDHEGVKELIVEAKQRAKAAGVVQDAPAGLAGLDFGPHFLIFEFENEQLEIDEEPHYIHHFIKEENYAFDTPTINVYIR